ncbi:hypothetical protein ACH5RR_006370 [Cinchona calisaya]|uniref:GAG-pre-integrase domain-containing protein n=1 Tax=Cinchona calisaya TaxID=153742 RepID=A0ABD3AP56_9GENT
MKGRRIESVYMMSAQEANVDKARKNETTDLLHARLGHVSYYKLKIMMKKFMLKGLPQLECCKDIVCAGCQYEWFTDGEKQLISRLLDPNPKTTEYELAEKIEPEEKIMDDVHEAFNLFKEMERKTSRSEFEDNKMMNPDLN